MPFPRFPFSTRAPRTLFAFFFSFGSVACSSSSNDSGDASAGTQSIMLGTYATCASGVSTNGNLFPNGEGFVSSGSLTLAQSAQSITATYVDENALSRSFIFTQTSATSAAVTPPGANLSGFAGLCVQGPGNDSFYPAVMSTTAGAMTYDQGTVFLALGGTLTDDAGACGAESAPATFWVLCEDLQGGTPAPRPGGAPPAPAQLPVGQYACATQLETHALIGATDEYVAAGGNGTLTLTQTGGDVTAQYAGDPALAGTLHLTATSATTASAGATESLTAPCTVPVGTTSGPSPTPATLPIASSSLAIVDTTLLVSFAGTMDASSSCSGARIAGTLVCTKK